MATDKLSEIEARWQSILPREGQDFLAFMQALGAYFEHVVPDVRWLIKEVKRLRAEEVTEIVRVYPGTSTAIKEIAILAGIPEEEM